MNTAAKGANRERRVKAKLEADDWIVYRGAASLGNADLVCLKAGEQPMLVQVKANDGNAWMNFRKPEREALFAEAQAAGAVPWLVHWPARMDAKWYATWEWPSTHQPVAA